jgi:hypothetical protein
VGRSLALLVHCMMFWLSLTQSFLPFFINTYFTYYLGSHIECMYSLMTFGIPVDRLPTSTDCLGLKAGRQVKFLNVLRNLEGISSFFKTEYGNNIIIDTNNTTNTNTDNGGGFNVHNNSNNNANQMTLVIVPNHSDVLFGRGKPIQMHLGNVWLGSIVEDMVPTYYQESSRDGKAAVAQRVVAQVKERGGRFLKQYQDGSGIWIEVNDEQGQEKVCTAFRSCRATKKNKKHSNTTEEDPNHHNNNNNNNMRNKRPRSM